MAPDIERLCEHVELFRLRCEELDCLETPFAFPSDRARVAYFRNPSRPPSLEDFDGATGSCLTLLSGLPGAGKDRWVFNERPDGVISMDDLRRERGVKRGDKVGEGRVLQAATEALRVRLRAGAPVCWNATSLTKQQRDRTIGLALDYRAHVRIVCLEAPYELLHHQNSERAHPVPGAAIDRMVGNWQFPTLAECHELDLVVAS